METEQDAFNTLVLHTDLNRRQAFHAAWKRRDEIDTARIRQLEDLLERAANSNMVMATKYESIVQAITDPENQPIQYGTVLLVPSAPELTSAEGVGVE